MYEANSHWSCRSIIRGIKENKKRFEPNVTRNIRQFTWIYTSHSRIFLERWDDSMKRFQFARFINWRGPELCRRLWAESVGPWPTFRANNCESAWRVTAQKLVSTASWLSLSLLARVLDFTHVLRLFRQCVYLAHNLQLLIHMF